MKEEELTAAPGRSAGDATLSADPTSGSLPLAASLFQAAFDFAFIGMAVVAPDSRWLRVNDALCRMLGYPADELVGTSYAAVTLAADRARDLETMDALLTGRLGAYQVERRLRRRDGRFLWVRMSAVVVRDPSGGDPVIVAQIEDIAERHDRELKSAATQGELRRSNTELEAFASVAAHDLQEPLRKIRAFGDRLQSGYGAGLDDRGRAYIERMSTAAERMQRLINDLLAYSRITSRRLPFESVDLMQIADEVRGDLQARLEETHGRIEIATLPTISADALQMRQLLQNLLGNALKFAAPDRAPIVRVSASLADRHHVIDVEDNGVGFDPAHADRIFAPFERLHGRFEYEGTGIGLAICRRIVERHGGSISADSTPGEGARFTVTLPVEQKGPRP